MRRAGQLIGWVSAGALWVAACAPAAPGEADARDDAFVSDGGGKEDGIAPAEAAAVLALVNRATFEQLDVEVGLDARAAEGIAAHRDGADGAQGTADDDPFGTLAELDAVPWVGPVAFERLAAHAASGAPCLIISEYFELWGNDNKAVELFNCGGGDVDLADHSICMVRNDDDSCSVTQDLGAGVLEPGDVTTLCRERDYHPASLDPVPLLAQRCDLERPGVMTFSGDDRLLVLRDGDGAVMDALGRTGYRPPESTWSNTVLRRCNLAPADGTSFYDTRDYFRRLPAADYTSWGAAPTPGCN